MSENFEGNEIKDTNEQSQQEESKKDTPKNSLLKEIFEWVYSIVIAIVLALVIKGFLFDVVKVDGLSMYPTLNHGERLIVTKIGYEPKQGDIVILDSAYDRREAYFDSLAYEKGKEDLSDFEEFFKGFTLPDDVKKIFYVKRVIATEGQTVDLREGKVYVDGQELDEPYYKGETYSIDSSVEYPIVVEEDHVFVMGDNRGHSLDSRSSQLGQVDEEAVLGKASLRIFPFNKIGIAK